MATFFLFRWVTNIFFLIESITSYLVLSKYNYLLRGEPEKVEKIPNLHFVKNLRIFHVIYQEVGEDGELDLFEFYFLLFSHVIP